MQEVLTLILGGGRGTRLYPLTKNRSEPAVPLAGKYRLIDIPISNSLNSGLNRIYVLTQFLSTSLHRHIAQAYEFDAFSRAFVEVLAAQQTNEAAEWYQGTADAIRQNLRYVQEDGCRDVLVLSGDQLYRMDFAEMLRTHRDSQADVTIGVHPVAARQAGELGILRVDDAGRAAQLVEKPRTDQELARLRTPPEWFEQRCLAGQDREYLANMGIYLFRRQMLFDCLSLHPRATDLVNDIFACCLSSHHLQTHLHQGYWEDLGTVRTYYEGNLALAGDQPPFDFHSPDGVIYTRMRFLPASRVSQARLDQCLVSDGCEVFPGTTIRHSVLGVRSRIGRQVAMRDTVMNGANRFETDSERADNRQRRLPDFGVGDGSVIERAILDKNCRVGHNVQIINRRKVQNAEGENYVIRDGIVVIPNEAIVPDGTVI